jgi:hypothetical protein
MYLSDVEFCDDSWPVGGGGGGGAGNGGGNGGGTGLAEQVAEVAVAAAAPHPNVVSHYNHWQAEPT